MGGEGLHQRMGGEGLHQRMGGEGREACIHAWDDQVNVLNDDHLGHLWVGSGLALG